MALPPDLAAPGATPAPHPTTESSFFTVGTLEAIVIDTRTGERHELNTSAAAVWALCDGQTTADQMVVELCEAFGIDADTAHQSVDVALEHFWKIGILAGSLEPPLPDPVDQADDAVADLPQPLPREPDP
jgi:hypothetical protein